jgi:hypothetical protein
LQNRAAEAEYLVRALAGVSFDEFVAARERLAAYSGLLQLLALRRGED